MIKRIQILTGKPLMTALLAMVVGGLIAMISSCSGGGDQTGAGNPPGGGGIDTNAIDAQAAAMAVDILTGGTQTEPAIQKALLASGFAIQAPDGSLTQPTQSPSQGMLFDQWEVYVMSVAENNSGFITLSDLASAIQANFPDLAKDKLTAFILDG
ncbi:MAG TPA: hypothetical protein VFG95_07555, partial [Nitrospiria bacterium]|nr:hypothetical protein [Nitrospiria bacterium]